jgi:hypothetical protein
MNVKHIFTNLMNFYRCTIKLVEDSVSAIKMHFAPVLSRLFVMYII